MIKNVTVCLFPALWACDTKSLEKLHKTCFLMLQDYSSHQPDPLLISSSKVMFSPAAFGLFVSMITEKNKATEPISTELHKVVLGRSESHLGVGPYHFRFFLFVCFVVGRWP